MDTKSPTKLRELVPHRVRLRDYSSACITNDGNESRRPEPIEIHLEQAGSGIPRINKLHASLDGEIVDKGTKAFRSGGPIGTRPAQQLKRGLD